MIDRLRGEDGMLTTEMAVLVVVFVFGFLGIVVFAGRVATAENDVRRAAHEAARAATLTRDSGSAAAAARQTAADNLTRAGMSCAAGRSVVVDTSRFAPGGAVSVTVRCTTPFGDLIALGVPGTRVFTASATEVIDTYRSAS